MKFQSGLSAVLGLATPAITTAPPPKPVFCTECGLSGAHADMCSEAPLSEERVFRLTLRIEAMNRDRMEHIARIDRLTDSVTKWQGRHAIVRHENNVLRRKLHPQPKRTTSAAEQGNTDDEAYDAFNAPAFHGGGILTHDTRFVEDIDTAGFGEEELGPFDVQRSPLDTVVVEK